MFDKPLEGLRIAVLTADGFEQVEVTRPVKALERAGAEVEIVSLRPGSIQGMNLLVPGEDIDVDRTIMTADPNTYSGLHIPGGFIGPDWVRQSERALDFVRAFEEDRKPISTICHGPWVLISAGLMEGRRVAAWPGIKDDIHNAGGEWVDEKVVYDDNWVSSRSPRDLHAFDKAIVSHFAQHAGVTEAAAEAVNGGAAWGTLLASGVAAATLGFAARQAMLARRDQRTYDDADEQFN